MAQLIAITIETRRVSEASLAPIVAAISTQVSRDFAPAWNIAATELRLIPRGGALPSGAWAVRLMERGDEEGDLGYHEDDSGNPEARIFIEDIERFAASLSVTVSHEILEMLADPLTTRIFALSDGRSAACEVCDPVEADAFGYAIDGVQVSDFVLPSYFNSSVASAGSFDFAAHLRHPCPALTPGGYQLAYDPHGGTWNTIVARLSNGEFSWRALRRGRGACRARGGVH